MVDVLCIIKCYNIINCVALQGGFIVRPSYYYLSNLFIVLFLCALLIKMITLRVPFKQDSAMRSF